MQGLGYELEGLRGLGKRGLRFGVRGFGFQVLGFGLRVQGMKCILALLDLAHVH